jgi:NAD(P)H-dependent FMN reductase
MVNIGIIAGSTRPGRFGIQPATWVHDVAQRNDGAGFELVDLQEIGLPLLDEANPPAMHQYEHEHTRRWAERVANLDGFIFVTAEYNHSIPGALKNAIDFVFREWNYKPASIVSYGSAAGGARAAEHLRGVLGEVKIYDLRDQLLLNNYWDRLDDQGDYQFSDEEVEQVETIIAETVFWAEQMAPIRERLLEPALAGSR